MYPCDQCDFMATQPSSLKIHECSIHREMKYSCDQCDYLTNTSSNLHRHTESKHLELGNISKKRKIKDVLSESCSKDLHKKSKRIDIIYPCKEEIVNNDEEIDDSLDNDVNTIDIEYNIDTLKREMNTAFDQTNGSDVDHTPHLPATKSFSGFQLLNTDSEEQEEKTDKQIIDEAIDCPICRGKIAKENLGAHLRLRHFRKAINKHLYVCIFCNDTATSKSSIELHIKTSHLFSPFPCDACDYKTQNIHDLQEHNNSVHLPAFLQQNQDSAFNFGTDQEPVKTAIADDNHAIIKTTNQLPANLRTANKNTTNGIRTGQNQAKVQMILIQNASNLKKSNVGMFHQAPAVIGKPNQVPENCAKTSQKPVICGISHTNPANILMKNQNQQIIKMQQQTKGTNGQKPDLMSSTYTIDVGRIEMICPFCNLKHSKSNMEKHVRLKHFTKIAGHRVVCMFCKVAFWSLEAAETHIERSHLDNPLPCELCDFKTQKFVLLADHKRCAHSTFNNHQYAISPNSANSGIAVQNNSNIGAAFKNSETIRFIKKISSTENPTFSLDHQNAISFGITNQITTNVGICHPNPTKALMSTNQHSRNIGIVTQNPRTIGIPNQIPRSIGIPNQNPTNIGITNQNLTTIGIPNQIPWSIGTSEYQNSRTIGRTHQIPTIIRRTNQIQVNNGIADQIPKSMGIAYKDPRNFGKHRNITFVGKKNSRNDGIINQNPTIVGKPTNRSSAIVKTNQNLTHVEMILQSSRKADIVNQSPIMHENPLQTEVTKQNSANTIKTNRSLANLGGTNKNKVDYGETNENQVQQNPGNIAIFNEMLDDLPNLQYTIPEDIEVHF